MYYDLSKALSYGAFLNILLGERGVGKTYAVTKFVTKKFIENGSEFAYIRRYKSELSKSVPKFFKPLIINNEFKDHTLDVKGSTFIIDDMPCGYAMTLSTAQSLKSTNFPNVKYIIFDEFIIEEGQNHYLKNEVENFLGLVETIARMRDVKIFLLGNAVTTTNPYFIYFDLTLPYGNDIKTFKDGLILVQYMKNEEYRKAKRETNFGKLVEGTEYSKYAIDNDFRQDNKNFIEHKSGGAKCTFTMIYNDMYIGVWFDYNVGKIFVSQDYNLNSYVFACTTNDHLPNTMLLSTVRDYNVIKTFIKNYKMGNVYYESVKIKNIMKEIVRLLLKIKN